MKRILFILVSSFLFLTAAMAQFPQVTFVSSNPVDSIKTFSTNTVLTFRTEDPASGNLLSNFNPMASVVSGNIVVFSVSLANTPSIGFFQVTVHATYNTPSNAMGVISASATTAGGSASTNYTTAVLAVELTGFSAKAVSSSKINLNWITASEKDNSMFKVEQSNNGINFATIGEVKGSGTSAVAHEYVYTDNNSYDAAIVYYQLISVDFAGSQSSSKTVSVTTGNKGKLSLDVVKNDGRVIFVSPVNENVTLSVYNIAGREVSHSTLAAYQGANNVSVDFSNLNAGLYIARLSNSNDAATYKFVKN